MCGNDASVNDLTRRHFLLVTFFLRSFPRPDRGSNGSDGSNYCATTMPTKFCWSLFFSTIYPTCLKSGVLRGLEQISCHSQTK